MAEGLLLLVVVSDRPHQHQGQPLAAHKFVEKDDVTAGTQLCLLSLSASSFNVLNWSHCRELLSLSTLRNHPYVVGLKEVYLTPHHLAIVMEYTGAHFFVQAARLVSAII